MLTFQAVLNRIQAALGAPGYSALRSCMSFRPLQLRYGDGPNDPNTGRPMTSCSDISTGDDAYYHWYWDTPQTQQAYISICPLFFYNYKAYMKVEKVPTIPYVNSKWFGSSIDNADSTRPSDGIENSFEISHHH